MAPPCENWIITGEFSEDAVSKTEFIELASGMLSSSYIYGEPVGTISSIAALGYSYTKVKNKENLRKFKWASIQGATGVAAFAISTKSVIL